MTPPTSRDRVTMSRRQFSALAGALAIGAWPHSARAADERRGPYIDIHTHLGQVWNRQEPLTADELLHWMDEVNVAKAVVLPLASPESSAYIITSDYVLEQTRPHRDRLLPFCCIDPRTSYRHGQQGLTDMIRKWKDDGALGFGEHKCGVAIDDDANLRLYEACATLELPVLFHMDTVRNFDEPGLPGLERVLKTFDTLPFIGHAQGWWSSISGDVTQEQMQRYPDTPVEPGGAIDRLMDEYPNIYGDLSAGSGRNAIARDLDFGRAFLIRRADRLLWGSDYLRVGQEIGQLELYPSIDLPDDVRTAIYRGNARRLLNLET